LTKVLLAIAVLGIAVLSLYPRALTLLKPVNAIDQGARPLIIVASEGGDRPLILNVNMSFDVTKRPKILLSFRAKGINYSEGDATSLVRYKITFVGTRNGDVQCGGNSDPVPNVTYQSLSQGTRLAIAADTSGGAASATNFSFDSPKPLSPENYKNDSFPEWSATLRVMDEDTGYYYGSRVTTRADAVWTEECSLSSGDVWRYPRGETVESAARKTLLIPQINWTSLGPVTDHQSDLRSYARVFRTADLELAEAYPTPSEEDFAWRFNEAQKWMNSLGQGANIGYTDQPVVILGSRSRLEIKDYHYLFAGVILGVVGAIAVSVTSSLFEAFWVLAFDRD
jgi:hypothetical protein